MQEDEQSDLKQEVAFIYKSVKMISKYICIESVDHKKEGDDDDDDDKEEQQRTGNSQSFNVDDHVRRSPGDCFVLN